MGTYEAKTKPTAQSVSNFIDAVEDLVRRDEARQLDTMMRRVSGQEPRMWGPSIIGYGAYHYRYASGHEGDAPRIGYSPRKAELVLYLMCCDGDRPQAVDALLARLGKHRTSVSCLYIRRLGQIDLAVLEQLAALSWQEMAKRYPD